MNSVRSSIVAGSVCSEQREADQPDVGLADGAGGGPGRCAQPGGGGPVPCSPQACGIQGWIPSLYRAAKVSFVMFCLWPSGLNSDPSQSY